MDEFSINTVELMPWNSTDLKTRLNYFILDVSKKEVIGKLFLSLHYLTPRTTYAYHLRNDKMDHLVQSMEFKIDFTYNKLLAGLKMFQPRGQTYWEDDSVDVSLTRIFELITRIVL